MPTLTNPLTKRPAPRGPTIKIAAAPRTRVRCLGPRPAQHWFLSAHSSERICAKCRTKQASVPLSAREMVQCALVERI